VAGPIAHADHEKLDLEIGGRFPLAKDIEYSLPRVLIFDGRTLRTFGPAN
jgi:hypothetical protein